MRDVIRIGLGVPEGAKIENARPPQILDIADIRRLIDAAWQIDTDGDWGGDLARLIVGLAATGSRFSQLTRCTVSDLDVGRRLLMVPVSRKGRGEKRATHTPVPASPRRRRGARAAHPLAEGGDRPVIRPSALAARVRRRRLRRDGEV